MLFFPHHERSYLFQVGAPAQERFYFRIVDRRDGALVAIVQLPGSERLQQPALAVECDAVDQPWTIG
jgi:hypothetical protein